MSVKITVIHHSADYDGLFCREIAKHFLPDAELIGWNFGDAILKIPPGIVYVMDLPVDRVFGFKFEDMNNGEQPEAIKQIGYMAGLGTLIWIDHHKTSIVSHPTDIPGYRIDGVAACRLAWQWFSKHSQLFHPAAGSFAVPLPEKQAFIDRCVTEPESVRLAGEYDIWDKRDPDAEKFQHGLRSQVINQKKWEWMLIGDTGPDQAIPKRYNSVVLGLLNDAKIVQFVRDNEYRDVITSQGFDMQWEGLTFLACCSHECDIRSHLFVAGVKPHHDALFGFTYTGKEWRVSLYHAPGKEHHDLSLIAKRMGGGGHAGACGFLTKTLPFSI